MILWKEENYFGGKKDGRYLEYHANGNLYKQYNYKNDKFTRKI